jgi:hypothetical protein
MKKLLLLSTILFTALSILLSQEEKVINVAPSIIKTIPELSDCNVDPSIPEIIIEFDQDMSNGMSLVDCPNMPIIKGDIKWIDKRKLSIPVQLYSDRLYQLAFNNEYFFNFANVSGVPLNPAVLIFRTKLINCKNDNKLAFSEFSNFFLTHYAYIDLKGIDWKTELSKRKSEFENTKTQNEFALKLYRFLQLADDPHITFESEGTNYIPCQMKSVEKNFNFQTTFKKLSNLSASRKWTVISGRYKNIAYINIGTWSNEQAKEISDVYSKLNEFKDEPNLIIDVRNNSGGNESLAKEFASCFVKDTLSYERNISYNEETGKFDKVQIKRLYPNKNGFYYPGNSYVLIGKKVMSSNESFVLMMKQAAKSKSIGMRTYGSSGNPIPFLLSNGITVNIPSWKAYTLDGKLIEGNGIEPDIEILNSTNDFELTDVLLDSVVKIVLEKNNVKPASNENNEFLFNATNLEKNLFDGKYYGELAFKPLIDSHIKRLIYNVNNPWLKSDLILKKDSSYYIIVNGLASTSRRKVYLWSGPEGATTNYKVDNFPSDSIAPFSIIGKLGTNGKIFSIANPIELTPKEDNELFIGYNDNLFNDNIGYFIIDIFKGGKEDIMKSLELSKNKIGKFYGETKEK